jgi:hypothetical protein
MVISMATLALGIISSNPKDKDHHRSMRTKKYSKEIWKSKTSKKEETEETFFCPAGSSFSIFGFGSFILIALQTVANIIAASK